MIEELAIITLVFLSQIGVLPEESGGAVFLNQFIEKEFVRGTYYSEQENWLYYINNLEIEKPLQPLPRKINSSDDFLVDAKSAVVLDAGTDMVLYSKNSDEKLPIASLTKIMTALVVLDNSKLDDMVIISENATKTEGKKNGLIAGEKIELGNILKIMLVESNNAAAVALAEYIGGNVDEFVKLMNEKAKSLEMKNTNFSNPDGLDQPENHSTAYEIAQLVDYAMEKPLLWDILRIQSAAVYSADKKIKHTIKNTNLLLGKFKNIAGGKTGFTDEAGQCLVLAVGDPEENHQIISVVLGASDRFLETERMVKWVFESYKW